MYSFPRNSWGEKALSLWLWCNSILSYKTMLLLINHNYTERYIYISRETSLFRKNICCIHLKRKTSAQLKVLIFKLLNDSYLFKFYKWNITIGWWRFFIVELVIAGMLIIQAVFIRNYAGTRAWQCWSLRSIKQLHVRLVTWDVNYHVLKK